jgi:hypothetical protein
MSDPYEGVTTPNPERQRLFRSVFRPFPLEEVAQAISAASQDHRDIYVERRGDQCPAGQALFVIVIEPLMEEIQVRPGSPEIHVGLGLVEVDDGFGSHVERSSSARRSRYSA